MHGQPDIRGQMRGLGSKIPGVPGQDRHLQSQICPLVQVQDGFK